MTVPSLLEALASSARQLANLNIRQARFGAPNPFKRVGQSMRGNHAVGFAYPLHSKPVQMEKTRQFTRKFLFRAALMEVNRANSKESIMNGRRCWCNIMPRAERRKLARAYAAKEWRRGNDNRGLKRAA